MKFEGYKEMQIALEQAKMAALRGEVPIGAVIVDEAGKVVSVAHNMVEGLCDGTAHAEMLVMKEAAQKLKKDLRLQGCTLYVTLEPCAMCATAISHSRIKKLVYGATDVKGGGVENGARIFDHKTTMHRPEIISGVMAEDCGRILQEFFRSIRD